MVTDKNEGANFKMDIKIISLVQEIEKEMDKLNGELKEKPRTLVVNSADVKGIRDGEDVIVIKTEKHIPGERFNNTKKEESR